jgi:hypothetical protein
MNENILKDVLEDEEFVQPCIEGELRKKIIDAQLFLERNKENINPIVYTELMFILERRTGITLDELEEICEKHQ